MAIKAINISDPELIKNIPEFQKRCMDRLEAGEKEYGPGTYNSMDVLAEAKEELLDVANYALFLYVKLKRIQEMIDVGVISKIKGDAP